MAYPEPIPVIKGKDAEEFLDRLKHFKLTPSQRQLFREGFTAFSRAERQKRGDE